MENNKLIELDIRPLFKEHEDPFQPVRDAVKNFERGDELLLHSTFKPVPLLAEMKEEGFYFETSRLDTEHWKTHFRKTSLGFKNE